MDIIDLWPGAGLWSSKVNDFLQPRRHILVEPDTGAFGGILEPLAKSKPCYQYLRLSPFRDLEKIAKYIPEPSLSSGDRDGALTKNDSLLILANPPLSVSSKDHFRPARWWSAFMETCINASELNAYGCVRVVASFPTNEARSIIPRSVGDRRRPAILTEALASNVFEVAATHDPGSWVMFTGWDLMVDGAAHVAKKTAEQNVAVPPGREPSPIPMAPESPYQLQIPSPYLPRVRTSLHDKYMAQFKAAENAGDDPSAKALQRTMVTKLNYDNREAFTMHKRSDEQIMIDRLVRRLARDAANPDLDFKALKPLDDQIKELRTAWEAEMAKLRVQNRNFIATLTDSKRCALQSDDFDKALLAWDRRPFEPLFINQEEELYPSSIRNTVFYFEADANSPVVRKLKQADPADRGEILRIFDALCLSLSSRIGVTAGELIRVLFSDRSTNEVVKAVPSLATHAFKRLKPDFDSLPKTIHAHPSDLETTEPLDPAQCFQENLDYDLNDVRLRVISATTLMDLAIEYKKSPGSLDSMHVSRAVGASLTTFRTGATDQRALR